MLPHHLNLFHLLNQVVLRLSELSLMGSHSTQCSDRDKTLAIRSLARALLADGSSIQRNQCHPLQSELCRTVFPAVLRSHQFTFLGDLSSYFGKSADERFYRTTQRRYLRLRRLF